MTSRRKVGSTFKGRRIVGEKGEISGKVIYSSKPIAFLQGVDPENGFVSDKRSEIYGEKFKGSILVFPNSVGSSVGAYVIYRLKGKKVGPLAMINRNTDIITASGCAIAAIPLFDISSGGFEEIGRSSEISIDTGTGLIRILK